MKILNDDRCGTLRNGARYAVGKITAAVSALFPGILHSPAVRLPVKKAFHSGQYCLFKQKTQHHNHSSPGKYTCGVQIHLGKIQLLSQRMGGNTDEFRRHTGLPAHSHCHLQAADQKGSHPGSVEIEQPIPQRHPENLRHLQQLPIHAADSLQGGSVDCRKHDQKTDGCRQKGGAPPDQQKHCKGCHRHRCQKTGHRGKQFLSKVIPCRQDGQQGCRGKPAEESKGNSAKCPARSLKHCALRQ